MDYIEFELNVPSGRLVIANDLRTWFPTDGDHNINTREGLVAQTLDYAMAGFACGFVGNTCPSVYKEGDALIIGDWPEFIDDPDYEGPIWDMEFIENPEACPWGEMVGYVTTDLWWYSLADYEDLRRRFAHYTPDLDFEKCSLHVVDVKPGVYRFRHTLDVARYTDAPVFAAVEWVREPDAGGRDPLEEDKAKAWTAAEILIQHVLNHPSLYLRRYDPALKWSVQEADDWYSASLDLRREALAAAADHVLCVIGNGDEWHPNGFPRTEVTPEATALAHEMAEQTGLPFGFVPPPPEGPRGWYPLSEYSVLYQIAFNGLPVSPTMLHLAVHVALNMVDYPYEGRHATDPALARRVRDALWARLRR